MKISPEPSDKLELLKPKLCILLEKENTLISDILTIIKVLHSPIMEVTLSKEDGSLTILPQMPPPDTELSHLKTHGSSLEEDGLLTNNLIATINTQSVKESFSTKPLKCTN